MITTTITNATTKTKESDSLMGLLSFSIVLVNTVFYRFETIHTWDTTFQRHCQVGAI